MERYLRVNLLGLGPRLLKKNLPGCGLTKFEKHFSTCFEHPCTHHQENQLYQYDILYMSLYVGDRLVCRFGWNIQTYTKKNCVSSWLFTRILPRCAVSKT